MLSLKKSTGTKEWTFWHPKKGYNSEKKLLLPSELCLVICHDMEQFVLLTASLYNNNNKSLNSQAAKKKELPTYQEEQNPTYQIASLKKKKRTKNCLPKQPP